ncbi:HAUS augmin-like complex subunit 6 [Acropora cervicornis]|uniref:HAUS augmin-like complex subunit 6 n=1 Tax=Acropora cervicornis TaxID=6130 RepID=A0AAD9V7Y3_ACRCE|nr:HAUS augmin-like complex subunit 6 [Acropora cervicornis]
MNESSIIKPVGIMPNNLDLREITFTNLLLLDFNPEKMESKYRVVFNRDMFVLPNKKAMEVVIHFLFTRLHPQLAYEELRDCWPIRDKFLEQQFRKVCFNWVSRIQKGIASTLFFIIFLCKAIHIPTFPTKTIHNHSFTYIMSQALEAHYIVLKKRFLEFTQQAVQVENHWKEYAMESTKEYRALAKLKRDLERQVTELNDYQGEVEALKRTQKLGQVRDLWSGITEFYSMQGPQRRIVDSVLLGEANKHKVDAADIQPMVPDMLLRDSEAEIKKRNIQDIYIGGKVNLLREAIERIMPDMKESVRKMKLHSSKNLEQKRGKPAEAPIMFVSKTLL